MPGPAATASRIGVAPGAGDTAALVFKTYHQAHTGKISLARIWGAPLQDGGTLDGHRYAAVYRMKGHELGKQSTALSGEVVGLGRMEAVATGQLLTASGKPAGDVDWPAEEAVVSHERLLRNRVKELHSSTLMMRRTAFDAAGLYDEDLPHGYGEDYDWLLRASRVGTVGAVQEILADIRKDVPSWFRDRWVNTATALEYMLDKHPDFADSRRGHARRSRRRRYCEGKGRSGSRRLQGRLPRGARRRDPAARRGPRLAPAAGAGGGLAGPDAPDRQRPRVMTFR